MYNGNVSTVENPHNREEDDKVKHVMVVRLNGQASTDFDSVNSRRNDRPYAHKPTNKYE